MGKTIDLRSGQGNGDCGYGFKKDEQYLVYAYYPAKIKENLYFAGPGQLVTRVCTGTKALSDANEEIAVLDQMDHLQNKGGTK